MGEERYTGFALQTDYGYNWVCRGTKKDELAAFEHGGKCVMKSTSDLCEDADDVCIGVGKYSTFAFDFKAGKSAYYEMIIKSKLVHATLHKHV